MTEILNKVKSASNRLNRDVFVSKEETKDKLERSRAEEKAEDRASKEEEEAALQDMIQAEVEYWGIQDKAMIE